jgi:murein DD-endopeptidase MepM/ murein hydrolase activator NlpD
MLSPVKSDPHYQVALGKYQFMTFRKEVVDEVTRNNGYGWLQTIWTGRTPTKDEVLKYFPPEAQERVMSAEVSTLLNQAQSRGAGANSLARTAAMIHNGGAGYTEGSSWTPGGLTVGQYGDQVLADYNAGLPAAQQKCKAAAAAGGVNPNNPGGSTGSFSNPTPGAPVTDEFSLSHSTWRGRPHMGIDIGAPSGSRVGAADGGRVDKVGWDANGWGNYVIVDHGNGYGTLYAHLNSVSVRQGQGVGKNDQVGLVGSTGGSTGPHLHLELIEGYKSGDIYSGYSVNPRKKINF